jgi:glycosyltransferase involved in cell wall biosynthesis
MPSLPPEEARVFCLFSELAGCFTGCDEKPRQLTMNRLPISVCMISGPEAHRIGRALESVAGWTAEIIVVMNEDARDGTEEIAMQHGAKVFRESWKGHVAQKNSAVDKAGQEWLLGLDADEAVSPELREEITRALHTTPADGPVAFSFPRLNYYCGRWIRHGDWYPDRKTRLWRRGKGKWVGEDPHDRLEPQGHTMRLHSHLLHYSNDSIAGQIAKIAPYQAEFVKRRVAAGMDPGIIGLAVRPWWKFMRGYFFRLGFLDGWQGFYIAATGSFSALTRQAMVKEARASRQQQP